MTVRSLLEQADRAERLARSVLDTFASEALMEYARECRDKAAAPSCGPWRQVNRFQTSVFTYCWTDAKHSNDRIKVEVSIPIPVLTE